MAINLLSSEKVEELLTFLGYKTPQTNIQSALVLYQQINDLPVTGLQDNQTERSLALTRFCATPEFITANASMAKWPRNNLTWGFTSQAKLTNFSREALIECFTKCFQNWAQIANLSFSFLASFSANPDITINTGRIDSPGNVLAWMELPNGSPSAKLKSLFDNTERYVWSKNPLPGEIDLEAVGTHEIGHALGIDHISGNTGDLMNPFYSSKIRTPQKGDIKQATARYGIPTGPSVPLPPSAPNSFVISIPVTTSGPITLGTPKVSP